ncbi:MAG: hypothetical protein ACI84F_003880, partial [Pseudoalteromonas tetraodonis]
GLLLAAIINLIPLLGLTVLASAFSLILLG